MCLLLFARIIHKFRNLFKVFAFRCILIFMQVSVFSICEFISPELQFCDKTFLHHFENVYGKVIAN